MALFLPQAKKEKHRRLWCFSCIFLNYLDQVVIQYFRDTSSCLSCGPAYAHSRLSHKLHIAAVHVFTFIHWLPSVIFTSLEYNWCWHLISNHSVELGVELSTLFSYEVNCTEITNKNAHHILKWCIYSSLYSQLIRRLNSLMLSVWESITLDTACLWVAPVSYLLVGPLAWADSTELVQLRDIVKRPWVIAPQDKNSRVFLTCLWLLFLNRTVWFLNWHCVPTWTPWWRKKNWYWQLYTGD